MPSAKSLMRASWETRKPIIIKLLYTHARYIIIIIIIYWYIRAILSALCVISTRQVLLSIVYCGYGCALYYLCIHRAGRRRAVGTYVIFKPILSVGNDCRNISQIGPETLLILIIMYNSHRNGARTGISCINTETFVRAYYAMSSYYKGERVKKRSVRYVALPVTTTRFSRE